MGTNTNTVTAAVVRRVAEDPITTARTYGPDATADVAALHYAVCNLITCRAGGPCGGRVLDTTTAAEVRGPSGRLVSVACETCAPLVRAAIADGTLAAGFTVRTAVDMLTDGAAEVSA